MQMLVWCCTDVVPKGQFIRFSLLCLPDHWLISLYHLILLSVPFRMFFILAFIFLCSSSFYIFSNSVEILTIFIHSPKFIEHFVFIILISLSDILLISTLLNSFSGIACALFPLKSSNNTVVVIAKYLFFLGVSQLNTNKKYFSTSQLSVFQ